MLQALLMLGSKGTQLCKINIERHVKECTWQTITE